MNPLAALRKLADEMRDCDRASGPCYAKDWAATLDSAIRLLGEGEAVAIASVSVVDGCRYVTYQHDEAGAVLPHGTHKLYTSPVPPAVVAPEGMVAVPWEPTEAMWSGLARSIFRAWDLSCLTPRKLFGSLEQSGEKIPDWLRNEPEMRSLDRVPSKGTRAVIIYKAMLNPERTNG